MPDLFSNFFNAPKNLSMKPEPDPSPKKQAQPTSVMG
jgi:hypothetical protein